VVSLRSAPSLNSAAATLYRDIPRVDPVLLAALNGVRVADIHDALPAAIRTAAILDGTLIPTDTSQRICGQAITAWAPPGDSLMSHCALYVAHPGDVLVISNGGVKDGAVFGGTMAHEAKKRGLAGAIIDAPIRDAAAIRAEQFPVWAIATSLRAGEKRGAGSLNMPIVCAGRSVNPGDLIAADGDGVLAFSPALIPGVIEAVRKKHSTDSALRLQIDVGARIFELMDFASLLESHRLRMHPDLWRSSATQSEV
jgi:4-hydroxy-4-methyl-2-oxoglutarate aldolase